MEPQDISSKDALPGIETLLWTAIVAFSGLIFGALAALATA